MGGLLESPPSPATPPLSLKPPRFPSSPSKPVSFLSPGINLNGTQQVTSQIGAAPDEWKVGVTIHHCCFKSGVVTGLMEAMNVPTTDYSVVTYWEGEIIDGVNHGFFTKRWQATKNTDLVHWKLFPAFRLFDERWEEDEAATAKRLQESEFIFMRWKEKFFVNVQASACTLTIAGFYYVCFNRTTGSVEGYYFDPNSLPFQHLRLMPVPKRHGFSFPSYEFS